jgi:uncharacterized YccA/Bax inhibitor family protein
MRSNNPVFQRSPEFSGARAPQGYGQTTPYSDPSTWSTGGASDQYGYADGGSAGRMTIDSVVQKTGLTLLVVVLTAALTWWWTGDLTQESAGRLYLALMVGSFGAFALSMVNSFKRVVSPPLVMAFAVLEGVAIGALSKFFDAQFGDHIVVQAVIGTFAAAAGVLAAYKFFNIQVGARFRTFVIAGMFGMVALGMLEMVLGMFGNAIGLFGFGGIGLLFALAGLAFGVFMLILDFDFVERGIAAGLDERESWRAAFAITVSLVWIYTNLLRILAILQQD